MFFYHVTTIYIPFVIFKSDRVWFEKYKLGVSFVSLIVNETVYSIFYNGPFTLNSKRKF